MDLLAKPLRTERGLWVAASASHAAAALLRRTNNRGCGRESGRSLLLTVRVLGIIKVSFQPLINELSFPLRLEIKFSSHCSSYVIVILGFLLRQAARSRQPLHVNASHARGGDVSSEGGVLDGCRSHCGLHTTRKTNPERESNLLSSVLPQQLSTWR